GVMLELGGLFQTKHPRKLLIGPGQIQALRNAGVLPSLNGTTKRGKKASRRTHVCGGLGGKKMNGERRLAIIQKLKSLGADKPCPRCEATHFDILGEGDIPLGPAVAYNRSLPSFIPGVVLACSKCGYLIHHALAILEPEKKNG